MDRGQNRITDITIGVGSHGLPCCPHLITGFRITGSPDVYVNDLRASRALIDIAIHDCPHCPINLCICGSPDVYINDYKAHRFLDCETEFCGSGVSVTGSPNVITNDY